MRKEYKFALVGVLAMSIVAATGCSLTPVNTSSPSSPSQGAKQGQQAENVMPTTVYVADSHGFVVPMNIKMAETKELAKATLEHMVAGSAGDAALAGTGLHNILPEGTQIRGISINNGLAKVDLSKEALNHKTAQDEQAMVDAVVWSMTGLDGVNKVQLLVEGRVQPTLKMGTATSDPISRNSGINVQVSSNVTPSNSTKLTLYFQGANAEGNFSYLVPVTRILPKAKDANMVDLTLAELAKGPNTQDLGPVMQPTMKPLKTEMKEKVATLDFGDDFQGAGDSSKSSLINSIVLSVAANATVDQIKFTINGKAPTAGKGMDLSKPVTVPHVINEQKL
jgi:germination protein M